MVSSCNWVVSRKFFAAHISNAFRIDLGSLFMVFFETV